MDRKIKYLSLTAKEAFQSPNYDAEYRKAHCSVLNPGSRGADDLDACVVQPGGCGSFLSCGNFFSQWELFSGIQHFRGRGGLLRGWANRFTNWFKDQPEGGIVRVLLQALSSWSRP
jgi:hypothetical protein